MKSWNMHLKKHHALHNQEKLQRKNQRKSRLKNNSALFISFNTTEFFMNKQLLLSLSLGLLVVALPACCCKKKQNCQTTEQTEQVAESAERNTIVDKF